VTGKSKGESEQNSHRFRGLLKAVHRLASEGGGLDAGIVGEMFQIAQWAVASEAASSLAQMAARQAKGDSVLARLIRERQDLVAEWQAKDKVLIAARSEPPGRRNAPTETVLFDRLAAIDARIGQIDKTLVSDFPEYGALARLEPLAVADVQALLRADEALLLILDTPELKPTPEESFIWLITKADMR